MASVFTGISDLLHSMTSFGQGVSVFKDARVGAAAAAATVAGQLTSLWQYDGAPSDGAAPTTVAIPTNSTAGALKQADASGGRSLYLLSGSLVAQAAGSLILYDRLLHIGNLSGIVTTAQTVGGSITRNTGGMANQIWLEIYTQIGATATTITASYTNESGTSGRTTQAVAIGGTGLREVQRMIQLPLASGDKGVQSVQSVTLLASTGTAGAFGVTLVHQLGFLPIGVPDCGTVRDWAAGIPDFPLVDAGACLAMAWLANTTTAPQVHGIFRFAEK